jgi:ABC-2 type transport system ATP-binding protein
MPDSMFAIEAIALTKRFKGVRAVQDLNLQISEGEVYALMGPNGAGKTTLIKLLMNLMVPTEGEARVLGLNSESLQGKRFEKIGYVSENQKMPDWMTIQGFLDYWRPFYPTWDKALEERLAKQFDLPRKRRLKNLSRGVRMKAALTSILAYRPSLIVLDEPLSGLDPLVRDELIDGLLGLAGETTILFSSHDLAEIEHFANHVGYMESGRLVFSETMEAVRQRFWRIEATAAGPIGPLEHLPATWLEFNAIESRAQWIETDYSPEQSATRAREVIGPIEIQAHSLTLREIFLASARMRRRGAANGGAL